MIVDQPKSRRSKPLPFHPHYSILTKVWKEPWKVSPWSTWKALGKVLTVKKEGPHQHLFSRAHVRGRAEVTDRFHTPGRKLTSLHCGHISLSYSIIILNIPPHTHQCGHIRKRERARDVTALHTTSKCPSFSEFVNLAGPFHKDTFCQWAVQIPQDAWRGNPFLAVLE